MLSEAVEGLDEEVYPLVAVLVAATEGDEVGALVDVGAVELARYGAEQAASLAALGSEARAQRRGSDVEAVGQHYGLTLQ